jgi:hypothetical protein
MAWQTQFNRARSVGYRTLCETISALKGNENVTEQVFKSAWLNRMAREPNLISEGWYSPPPDGITILTASPADPARLAYSSLRSTEYWPSARPIGWRNGFLLAYCSPIDKITGLAGDLAVTLYFGSEPRFKDYFRRAHGVVRQLLDSISAHDSPEQLLNRAEVMFRRNDLVNCATSTTDKASYNIGHTIPVLDPRKLLLVLSEEQRDLCRIQRCFLNRQASWHFSKEMQFTVEPQLGSSVDDFLPQLTFHYLVHIDSTGVHVCRDIDGLLREFGLTDA